VFRERPCAVIFPVMHEHQRWEGPAQVVVRNAVSFPGHLSLWSSQASWAGQFVTETLCPIEGLSPVVLQIRGSTPSEIHVTEANVREGLGSPNETTLLFEGLGMMPEIPSDSFFDLND